MDNLPPGVTERDICNCRDCHSLLKDDFDDSDQWQEFNENLND